jgi:hypothetical protein
LVATFFDGSPGQAAAALLDHGSTHLSDEDWDRLSGLIEQARRRSPRRGKGGR